MNFNTAHCWTHLSNKVCLFHIRHAHILSITNNANKLRLINSSHHYSQLKFFRVTMMNINSNNYQAGQQSPQAKLFQHTYRVTINKSPQHIYSNNTVNTVIINKSLLCAFAPSLAHHRDPG